MDFTLLSMVQSSDVISYLLAVKSFARFANPRKIVIVADPSLRNPDIDMLRRHLPHVVIHPADQFSHPAVPHGGTWERLLAISEYVKSSYVVQLDADTLALAPLKEVWQAITEKRGFVLGEASEQKVLTFSEIAHWAVNDNYEGPIHAHVQAVAEVTLPEIGLGNDLLYVRGCSGFTGFPANPDFHRRLTDFSSRMGKTIGARWSEWGSEQVASNYMVANANKSMVLPFPKYGTPDHAESKSAFLHFIGYLRYRDRRYESTAAEVLGQLTIKAGIRR